MKALRLSLFSALLGSSAAMAAAIPEEMAGSYQALLYADSPAGLVDLKVTTKGAVTGKLTTPAKKVYSFKTTLDYTAGDDIATEGTETGVAIHTDPIAIKVGKDIPDLNLELVFRDFADNDTLEVTLEQDETILGVAEEGFKVKTYAKGETALTVGSYTVAFELAEDVEGAPEGSGYAVAKMDAKGILKLTGATGDGTKFTASLPNGPANQFVLFANPYKRDGCFLAGKIVLSAREGGGFHMAPPEVIEEGYFDLQWQKTGTPKDKSYRDGFGPLDLLVSVEPWNPEAKQAVADYFELGDDEVFEFALSEATDIPSDFIPTSLVLTAKNQVQVTSDLAESNSISIEARWPKILKGKVDPKTGKFTATINVENTVADKKVKRKVLIEGVLLKLAEGDDSYAFQGFVLIPSLVKGGEIVFGAAAVTGIVENPQIAANAATAGTYSATLVSIPTGLSAPSGTPSPGPITFTISPDLKTLTFGGRDIPLSASSVTALSYIDKKGTIVAITLNLNTTTKQPFALSAAYGRVGRQFATFSANDVTKN